MSATDTEKISFISSVLGTCQISRDGRNAAVACPQCGDKEKKKLAIRLEDWQFHCWVCGFKGKSLIPILRKCSVSEVISYYRERFLGHALRETQSTQEVEEKVRLPDDFTLFAESSGKRDPDVRACFAYLKERGVTQQMMWRYRLGYSTQGRHRRRIIMPSFDFDGELNYFVSRTIDSNFPKYLNCKSNKTRIVFNDVDIDWDKEIVVCEGPFDLMKCGDNTTCLLGSSLSEDSLLFKKIVANETDVILALDADMQEKTQKIAASLTSYNCNVRILDLSGHKDVGEMDPASIQKAKQEAKPWQKRDMTIFKIGLIRSASLL